MIRYAGAILAAPDMLGISTSRYDNSQEIGSRIGELERRAASLPEDSPERKDLEEQAGKWEKLKWRAQNQPGELPKEYASKPFTPETEESEEENSKQREDAAKRKTLPEIIDFYEQKKDTLFSFAKDELEYLIISHADHLQKRRQLTDETLSRVKKIFPFYDLSKVVIKPEEPKKLPKIGKDFPKQPTGKKLLKPLG